MQNTNPGFKLLSYSTMAASFLFGSAISEAQVVHTDIDPDETYSADNDFYELDLNNDGSIDFKIGIRSLIYPGFITNSLGSWDGLLQDIWVYPYNGVVAGSIGLGGYAYPYVLNSGDLIYNDLPFQSNTIQTLVYYVGAIDFPSVGATYQFFFNGNWKYGAGNKYLGLRLDIDADSFYGWVRLDVSNNRHQFTIYDYAYRSSPDSSINAGEATIIHNVIQNNELTAYSSGNTVQIIIKNFSTTGANVKVYNINGEVVYQNNLNLNGMSIPLHNLFSGYYTLQIVSNENSVFTKKLFIQN